jgi:hypothetical protein
MERAPPQALLVGEEAHALFAEAKPLMRCPSKTSAARTFREEALMRVR